jgi:hypothetical protein
MRKLRALVALLVLLAVPAVARAEMSIAVLGFEAIEVPEDLANQMTLALRARAAHAKLRVVAGKPLVEMKLVFGCLDEAPACMSQIGASLGAEKLLYGAIRKSRTGYSVTLKFLDVSKARVENEQTFQLVKGDTRDVSLRVHADRWFVAVTGLKATGTLKITPSVSGAKVFVDDVVVGISSGLEPVVAGDLRPGKHEIVVVATKYKRFAAAVRVGPGETLEINAQLDRDEDLVGPVGPTGPTGIVAPTGTTSETPGRNARIAAWTTGGASLAAFVAAIAGSFTVRSLNNRKQAEMVRGCSAPAPDMACLRYLKDTCGDSTIGPECRFNVPGNDACAAAAFPDPDGSNQPRNARVASLCKQGKAWATAQWVLYPIGAAFAAASGYFFWTGYTGKKPVEKERATAARLRLRLEPVVGPTITAFTASLEF